MATIMFTGGLGFVGSHCILEVAKPGDEIIIVDNLVNSYIEVVEHLKQHIDAQFIFCKLDILDYGSLLNVTEKYKPTVVFHFAGLKSVFESSVDPLSYYENNVVGSFNLLKVMSHLNIKHLVFSSSATVYGQPNYLPYDESHAVSPVNPYGQTKLHVENMINDWVVSGNGRKAVCLRYFNPVGAHKSGHFGEVTNGKPNNLMPAIMEVAIGNQEYLTIFGDDYDTDDGSCERDYIHIEDLSRAHAYALAFIQRQKKCFDVFNIGTGKPTSVFSLIESFENSNNIKIPSKIVGRRDGDLPRFWADTRKANTILGFETRLGIDDMCHDAWSWKKTNKI